MRNGIGMKVVEALKDQGIVFPPGYDRHYTAIIERELGVNELVEALEKIASKSWTSSGSQRIANEALKKFKGE